MGANEFFSMLDGVESVMATVGSDDLFMGIDDAPEENQPAPTNDQIVPDDLFMGVDD